MSEPLLRVEHLKKYFKSARGMVHAVDDVSFTLEAGKTLGVVGESGCGKSTLGRTIIRLQEPTSGSVFFDGKDVSKLNRQGLWEQRRQMQMIFQDPFSSLNPRMTISQAIEEPLALYKICPDRTSRQKRVAELMDTVGLARRLYNTYPHELDGGRRQRIGIARALALNPRFIVCDEPVSALDVSIQAQILNLMQDLQKEFHLTYMFITHDLSVVYHISDEIMVMYLGQVIEKAPAEKLFANPVHPYTQALLSAIPVPSLHDRRERVLMTGELTSPIDPPAECRFSNRCRFATDHCREAEPQLLEVEPGHFVSCFLCER
ncbi:ABC transporter ATP-binding protein [Oscillibacter valericigenes]|uniref:Dipeptide ABC transporter ATP-binding protein n=1 Tax=Oscillibacter valericigenes TaxID=351091 RepID=A0ABS2FU02_9FIRM|nr:dipeptide ABC transporter ATP-binding protein [Oscillibacter valericigenes]MBM6850918.1 dipeptide ABC transporter ATP-binding protein [Oscillibacter valericigenes]MBM6909046.1 dipeptide ABC transporter ATP-binding protein [Oscillibacter valericigenes]HJB76016.1 dipeptide ABC transporter ATP-binding protein [Candidatus Oscillibacter avistercoris]